MSSLGLACSACLRNGSHYQFLVPGFSIISPLPQYVKGHLLEIIQDSRRLKVELALGARSLVRAQR